MKLAWCWVSLGLLAVCIGGALAKASDEVPPAPRQDRVEDVMGRYNLHPAFQKLGRGLANLVGGWLEIPLNIHQRYSKHDTAGSFFTGAVYGVVKGVVRTGVGAYEAVTFFLPYPEHFAPILPTLEYFQQTPHREPLPLE